MAQQRKLLDQVQDKARLKRYSYRTEKSYLLWFRRYILFHGKRHSKEMGHVEVEALVQDLAVERDVATCPASGRGGADEPLYHMPYPNVHDDARICAGETR